MGMTGASLQWRSVADQIGPKVPKLAAIRQCRLNFPQKRRSKIPQFGRSGCRGEVCAFLEDVPEGEKELGPSAARWRL